MRKLSLTAADGVAANWTAMDGTTDTFATQPPAVDADKIIDVGNDSVAASADIRGGTSSFKDDLYIFVQETQNDRIIHSLSCQLGQC